MNRNHLSIESTLENHTDPHSISACTLATLSFNTFKSKQLTHTLELFIFTDKAF